MTSTPIKSNEVREREKKLAGECAAGLVREGMRVGLGTGSTAQHLIRAWVNGSRAA